MVTYQFQLGEVVPDNAEHVFEILNQLDTNQPTHNYIFDIYKGKNIEIKSEGDIENKTTFGAPIGTVDYIIKLLHHQFINAIVDRPNKDLYIKLHFRDSETEIYNMFYAKIVEYMKSKLSFTLTLYGEWKNDIYSIKSPTIYFENVLGNIPIIKNEESAYIKLHFTEYNVGVAAKKCCCCK